MNRTLHLSMMAAAALACASQQKPSSSGARATGVATEEQASSISPSSLSPEQIRLVQRSLVDRGFAVDLTGAFDEPTQRALTDFQRARGLPANGNLNTPTVEALGLDPRDVMPVRGQGTSPGAYQNPAGTEGTTPGEDSAPRGGTSTPTGR